MNRNDAKDWEAMYRTLLSDHNEKVKTIASLQKRLDDLIVGLVLFKKLLEPLLPEHNSVTGSQERGAVQEILREQDELRQMNETATGAKSSSLDQKIMSRERDVGAIDRGNSTAVTPAVYSLEEVCTRTGYSKYWIWRMCKKGLFPFLGGARGRKYPIKDVEEWIENRTVREKR